MRKVDGIGEHHVKLDKLRIKNINISCTCTHVECTAKQYDGDVLIVEDDEEDNGTLV